MYAPETTVSGSEIIPSPAHGVAVSSEQYEITLGIKYFYDAHSLKLRRSGPAIINRNDSLIAKLFIELGCSD
jgi:hypothetical protein